MHVRFDGEAGTYRFNHEEGYIEFQREPWERPEHFLKPEDIPNLDDRAEVIHRWFRDRLDG